MPKWGQIARFLINTKQKLGLSVPKTDEAVELANEIRRRTAEPDKT